MAEIAPCWRIAAVDPEMHGPWQVQSLFLEPLVGDSDEVLYLMTRFWTPEPDPARFEGDCLYFSLSEAYEDCAIRFGIFEEAWKPWPRAAVDAYLARCVPGG